MSPTDRPRRGSGRRRRGRALTFVLGGNPNVASNTLLRRARTIRLVSGTGSDDDRTTLRKRENAVRQRRRDDNDLLPGHILLQRVTPAGSVFDLIRDLMAVVRALRRVDRGIATIVTMVAVPRRLAGQVRITITMTAMSMTLRTNALASSLRVKQVARVAGDVSGHTLNTMPMTTMGGMVFKLLPIGGGPRLTRAAKMGKRRRRDMVMMPMMTMIVRRIAGAAAGKRLTTGLASLNALDAQPLPT